MFAILIIPILICGIIWIKSHPSESLKIGTFQGWLVYLYAIKYGFYFLTAVYITSDFIVPYLFQSKLFLVLISHFDYGKNLADAITNSSINELSLLNLSGLFILHSTVSDVVTFISKENQSILTSKIIALSIISFLLSLLFGYATVWYNKKFGLYKKKVAKIYQEKSPSDYLLMKITDNFIDEKIREDNRLNKLRSYNKKGFSFTPKDRLLKRIKIYTSVNTAIYITLSPLRFMALPFGKNTKYYKATEIPNVYRETAKMYRQWLRDDKKEYKTLEKQELPPEKRKFSLISMKSRKIYIGVPISTGKPDEEGVENKEVLILPYFSGYRKEKDMGIDITNRYLIEHGDHIDIDLIALPKAEIASISAFSMDMHSQIDGNMKKNLNTLYYARKSYLRTKKRFKILFNHSS